jgi:uncharacterized protein (DUF427 family)
VTVAETDRALRVDETRHGPVLYVPLDHIDPACLAPSERTTYCPFKGHAAYFHLIVGGTRTDDALWHYPDPYAEVAILAGHGAFYGDRVDAITVDDRPFPDPEDP